MEISVYRGTWSRVVARSLLRRSRRVNHVDRRRAPTPRDLPGQLPHRRLWRLWRHASNPKSRSMDMHGLEMAKIPTSASACFLVLTLWQMLSSIVPLCETWLCHEESLYITLYTSWSAMIGPFWDPLVCEPLQKVDPLMRGAFKPSRVHWRFLLLF